MGHEGGRAGGCGRGVGVGPEPLRSGGDGRQQWPVGYSIEREVGRSQPQPLFQNSEDGRPHPQKERFTSSSFACCKVDSSLFSEQSLSFKGRCSRENGVGLTLETGNLLCLAYFFLFVGSRNCTTGQFVCTWNSVHSKSFKSCHPSLSPRRSCICPRITQSVCSNGV